MLTIMHFSFKGVNTVLMSFVLLGLFFGCALFALCTGHFAAGDALVTGAQAAVSFAVALSGGLCLWSGVMELMERSGLSAALSRALRPVLLRLFPRASREPEVMRSLCENLSANLLGLGNAATPSGIRAAKGMAALPGGADELCLLVVLNTASLQILPTTIASVRASLGASASFDILPAVWLSSLLSVCAGLLAARLLRQLWR